MKVIRVDEPIREVYREAGGRAGVAELEEIVGGRFRIDGTVTESGVPCYMISRVTAYTDKLPQNMSASRMLGRMVWGTVVLAIKGVEVA